MPKITITRSLACTGMMDAAQLHHADDLMTRLIAAYWPDATVQCVDGGEPGDDPEIHCDGIANSSKFDCYYHQMLRDAYTSALDAVFDGNTVALEALISAPPCARPHSVHVTKNQLGIFVENAGLFGRIELHDREWFLQIGPRDCDGYWIERPLEACVGSYIEYDAINLDAVKLAAEAMASVYDARQFFPRPDRDQ